MEEQATNRPAPRFDRRAAAIVALGVAGTSGLAWWLRQRRRTKVAAASAPVPVSAASGKKLTSRPSGAGTAALALLGGLIALGKPAARRRRKASANGVDWVAILFRPARGAAASNAPEKPADIAGAARKLRASAGLLGLSVLADSGLEHYRGGFENPAMVLPLAASTMIILVSIDDPAEHREARAVVHLASAGIGLIGLGFHAFNIGKRPGGYDWPNFFYGAPFGAPAALILAALIGHSATLLDPARPAEEQRIAGLPFGAAMAGVTSIGLLGTVAEVSLLHFRGAFENPFMWVPVSLPPVAALVMAEAAVSPGSVPALGRAWLWTTLLVGIAGVGFHAYGISRRMGGWANWSQNILAGPPLPAPPSFSALALAGLAALDLSKGSGR